MAKVCKNGEMYGDDQYVQRSPDELEDIFPGNKFDLPSDTLCWTHPTGLCVSPLELAIAYATLLQNGSRPTPVFVRELIQKERTLFSRPAASFPAFADHSRLKKIPDFIRGLSLPGTDHWAASLSPEAVIVVWIGYDNPKPFNLSPRESQRLKADLLQIAR